ncbi:MAG: sterol desaturase family protein, partial [Gammaproteobacteria bacterium]
MTHSIWDYCERFVGWILDECLDIVQSPFNASNRLYWVFLLSALLLAAIAYKRYYHRDGVLRFAEFFKFVFPKRIYGHPSAIIDYKLFISNHFIGPVTFGPFAEAFSAALVAGYVTGLLASAFAATWQGLPIGGGVILAFTIVYALVSDLVTYINHRLHHQVDLLWPIHRVHHSAEVLTPFTLFRKHPLYNIVKLFVSAPVLGVFQGITVFLFLGEIEALTIFGINAVSALFRIFGANLRHSHI